MVHLFFYSFFFDLTCLAEKDNWAAYAKKAAGATLRKNSNSQI
jgi:hypothetical protein